MGKLLRFSGPNAVWHSPENELGEILYEANLSAILATVGVDLLDRKGALLCRTCGAHWKADFRQPLYTWVYCPNSCNAG